MRTRVIVVALVAAFVATVAPASAFAPTGGDPHVQAAQTITFGPLTGRTFGAAPFNVSATTTANDVQQGSTSGSMSNDNTCLSTLRPSLAPLVPDETLTLPIGMSGSAAPFPHLGDQITLSETQVTVTMPTSLYLLAYNSGIVTNGQVIPVIISVAVAGSNTTEVSHQYAVQTSVTLSIHDPDGVPNTGDESVDPPTRTVSLPNTVWDPTDATLPVFFSQGPTTIRSAFVISGTSFSYTQACNSTLVPVSFVVVDGRTSTLAISFASLTTPVCSVTGSTVTVLAAGVCTIEATQAGDADWVPATPVDRSFVVGYRVANLTPTSSTRFTRGSTMLVRFELTDASGQPIPIAIAASLGCSVTVTFNAGSPACAAYSVATQFFGADIKTAATLAEGERYAVVVHAVVGPTIVASATAVPETSVSTESVARTGYWMLDADGKVYAFGDAPNLGIAPGPAVAMTARADGTGYWIVDAAGNVSHFGSATGHGAKPALRAGESVSTISATPTGNGYWLFTNRGRALPFGDAHFFGDMSAVTLNGAIIASVATPNGGGYYMVGSDGGVFTFGNAHFHGSTGGVHLNRPVVGISPTPDNRGYWLVASDGGVFAFDAPFRGSMGAVRLNKPVNGLVAFGNGYLMVASDGGIFDLSDTPFAGSLASDPPAAPIIGVAAFSR
jgi:hypothetical protein